MTQQPLASAAGVSTGPSFSPELAGAAINVPLALRVAQITKYELMPLHLALFGSPTDPRNARVLAVAGDATRPPLRLDSDVVRLYRRLRRYSWDARYTA